MTGEGGGQDQTTKEMAGDWTRLLGMGTCDAKGSGRKGILGSNSLMQNWEEAYEKIVGDHAVLRSETGVAVCQVKLLRTTPKSIQCTINADHPCRFTVFVTYQST